MTLPESKATKWLAAILVSAGLLMVWAQQLTGRPIVDDALQSYRMALNLVRHGTMSMDEAPPYLPSDYREPIPVAMSALILRLQDRVWDRADPETYLAGDRLRFVKHQNLFWMGLLAIGAFCALRVLGLPFYFALAGMVLVTSAFVRGGEMLDSLNSEPPAAALLLLGSVCLARAAGGRRPGLVLSSGLLFGAAALVKAAMLYVFAGLVACVALLEFLRSSRPDARIGLRGLALMVGGFACVVTPWMLRNYLQLGAFQIAERAGVVLMCRAVKDGMTGTEYLGAFYVWAPGRLRGPIGAVLGFSPGDLKRGGVLQRLNRRQDSDFGADDLEAERAGWPELAISYYRKSRAERMKLIHAYGAAGDPRPDIRADAELKRRATQMIMEKPLRHLALTVPFLWRGAPLAFPILLVALALAWHHRRPAVGLLALPALGLVLFCALFSHFIPRYADPVMPVVAVMVVASAYGLWLRWRRPWRSPQRSAS